MEQSCVVWNANLTKQNIQDLERVQKNAFRLILKDKYYNYNHALEYLNLQNLQDRRNTLSLKFAVKNLNNKHFSEYFIENKKIHQMETRKKKKYKTCKTNKERFKKSAIPSLQRSLNEYEMDKI